MYSKTVTILALVIFSLAASSALSAQVDSMLYEIVQTNPNIGAIPPDPNLGFCSSSGGVFGCDLVQRYVRLDGNNGQSIVGSWLSAGADVAPLLVQLFNVDSIYATFEANNTYLVRQIDFSGVEIQLAGTYTTSPSGVGNIQMITVNQSSPVPLTSEGIIEITTHPLGIDDQENHLNSFRLAQNFPNPFNPSTRIEFTLPVKTHVILKVYNLVGKEVATLLNESRSAGDHSLNFKAENLASGLYFYRITAGKFTATKKMMLVQ